MKKLSVWLACMLLLSVCAAARAADDPIAAAQIEAPSGILMEAETGTVLFEKNAHERMAPASVTKIMTMLLITEALEDGRISLDDTVTVSEHAASMGGSQVYLSPNERMSVHDMLKSIAVASANDACAAIAEHLSGSETAFVAEMNAKAASLGMEDTHFDNCCGLDSETHYTSAFDIAVMSRELLRHELIRSYTTIWMDSIREGAFGLTNTNKLVRFYDGATGLKTGFTSKAMYCISATAQRGGMELIAVVMHGETSKSRNADASGLLNYGFANYALVRCDPDGEMMQVPVLLGQEKLAAGQCAEDGALLVRRQDAPSVEKQVVMSGSVSAPVEKGQRIGEVRFLKDGELLKSVPILARFSVEKRSLGDIFSEAARRLLLK